MTSLSKLFSILILITTFESILRWSIIPDLPLVFWWIVNSVMIAIAFTLIFKSIYRTDETPLLFVKVFIFWVFITDIRGGFVAENYWEWKNLLDTSFVFFIPLFLLLFANQNFLKNVLSNWFKYMLLISIAVLPFVSDPTFLGHYYSPILLLLLILPLLPWKWKILVLLVTISILLTSLESRSTVIKLGVALLFGTVLYAGFVRFKSILKIAHIGLFALPIVLLALGITGTFNVFKIKEYAGSNIHKSKGYSQKDLSADTRTFIYVETISSALKHGYVLEGRTPARGYDSPWFGDFNKWELGTGKRERFSSEVSILTIFTWYGLVGVFLYFLIFFQSSYLALYKSNNDYIKVIGLFIAFRWAYAFVEDFSVFGIQYIMLWIFIAMGLSSSLRNMTNQEFDLWTKDLILKAKLFKLGN